MIVPRPVVIQPRIRIPFPAGEEEVVANGACGNDRPATIANRRLAEGVIDVGFRDRAGGIGQVDDGAESVGRVVVGGAAFALQRLVDARAEEIPGHERVGIIGGFDDEIFPIVEAPRDDPVDRLRGPAAEGVVGVLDGRGAFDDLGEAVLGIVGIGRRSIIREIAIRIIDISGSPHLIVLVEGIGGVGGHRGAPGILLAVTDRQEQRVGNAQRPDGRRKKGEEAEGVQSHGIGHGLAIAELIVGVHEAGERGGSAGQEQRVGNAQRPDGRRKKGEEAEGNGCEAGELRGSAVAGQQAWAQVTTFPRACLNSVT